VTDTTARLWDVQTGTLIAALLGHQAAINSVAFSASDNGRHILTASGDGTVRIWPMLPGIQDFVDQAKKMIPRCLPPMDRSQAFLEPAPPDWCIEMEKPPFQTREWKEWLAAVYSGRKPDLPKGDKL
jgi:WD40 repeat protein